MENKCCVYWIHTPDQTDIFSQGYIGVSVNGIKHRYKQHVAAANRGSELPIHRAIRKYKDLLIIEVILVGSREYCCELEFKLRPLPYIGYNVVVGGTSPGLNYKHTEATKAKLSTIASYRVLSQATKDKLRILSTGRKHSSETREKMKAKRAGRLYSEDAKLKMKTSHENLPPWCSAGKNRMTWLLADDLYALMQHCPSLTTGKIGKLWDIDRNKIKTMFSMIKSGWNPLEDKDWLIFSSKLTPDASGDKSLEPAKA